LAKSAQKLFFATMRKKRQPNAEKRDFLLKNVTFCHGKKYWGGFCIPRLDATKSHLVITGSEIVLCTFLKINHSTPIIFLIVREHIFTGCG
jgi:hypothetical protein